MKKVVILNGSNSNKLNTAGMIAASTKRAEEAGNEVVKFDVAHMNIHRCLGCMRCMTMPKDAEHICVQKDEMDKVYPAVMDADVIVFASPMYWWGVTGQLKLAIDRLQAITNQVEPERLHQKSTALLMTYRGGGAQAALAWYDVYRQIAGCKNLGAVIGIADQKVQEAYELGKSIQ